MLYDTSRLNYSYIFRHDGLYSPIALLFHLFALHLQLPFPSRVLGMLLVRNSSVTIYHAHTKFSSEVNIQ